MLPAGQGELLGGLVTSFSLAFAAAGAHGPLIARGKRRALAEILFFAFLGAIAALSQIADPNDAAMSPRIPILVSAAIVHGLPAAAGGLAGLLAGVAIASGGLSGLPSAALIGAFAVFAGLAARRAFTAGSAAGRSKDGGFPPPHAFALAALAGSLGAAILATVTGSGEFASSLPRAAFDAATAMAMGFLFREEARRRVAEEAARLADGRYRSMQEQSLLGMVHCALDGRYIWVNARFREMVDREYRELAGTSFLDVTHPSDAERSIQNFNDLVAGKIEGYSLEKRYARKDGSAVWAGISVSLVRGSRGEPDYVAAVIEDISARKKAQFALAESELRYRTLIELLPQMVYLKGRDLRYLSCNTCYARELGVTPAGVLGRGDEDFFSPELAARFRAEDLSVLETGLVKEFEALYPSIDGAPRWMRVAKVPVRGDAGEVGGVLGVFFDISEQRLMTEEVRAANEELEERVRERTAELEAAKEAAESALHARGEFLANVSHEIRTPLNALIGFSELLDSREEDPKRKEYLRAMRASGRSLLTIINDILDLSRLESGKQQPDSRPVDLRGLFAEIERVFSAAAAEKALAFSAAIDETVPAFILADEARLRQALLNLAGNAVKFTARGSVSIDARTLDSAEGRRLAISVSDTGIGIPANDRERIFEAFAQQSAAIGSKYGGTGLGLAITKRLAQGMGGGISVESEEGKGSRFLLDLPCRAVSGADTAGEGRLDDPAAPGGDPGSRAADPVSLASSAAAAVPEVREGSRQGLERLMLRAYVLGSGALSITAVGHWAADLKALGAESGSEPVIAFAALFAEALARFDIAAIRESLAAFGSSCRG